MRISVFGEPAGGAWRRRLALPGLALLVALAAAGCGRGPEPGAPHVEVPHGTPFVLVSIDTLRSDHLPAYGYQGVETPAIDAFRSDSVLFEHAYSHEPLTLPSHTSILTGRIPPGHGVRDNIGYRLDTSRTPTLQMILKKQGYATGGAVSAFVLRGNSGLAQGFDFYQDSIEFHTGSGLGGVQRPGSETLRLALPWLDSVAGKPFFLFFHIYEPHSPYEPPEPFASRYASSPYDGEIATADRIVGRLFAELKRLGVYDEALIVLLSDHGEGLGDHGEQEHGILLYREDLQVPLMLKLPHGQLAGKTVSAVAALVDIFPTVVSLLGAPPPAKLDGVSLLTLLGPDAPHRRIYSETFYPRIHFGWSDLASLITGRYHYIEGPDPELYNLTADPGERSNVLVRERRLYASMRDELAGYDRALKPPAEEDEKTRQALVSLGYVGSTVHDTEGPLPDPKSQIHTLKDLTEGFRHYTRKEFEEAAASFRRAIDVHPQMMDAWEYLARSLQKSGHPEQALDAYKEALKLSGGTPYLALSAASLYLELGRTKEAEAHARLALDDSPAAAHSLLAQIAVREKKLDEAERYARLARQEEPDRLAPALTLADVLEARRKPAEALQVAAEAERAYGERERKDPDLIRGLYLVKGKALADLSRAAEAEEAFQQEIRLFPRSREAYTNLALLYALSAQPEKVGPTLKRMVEADPSPAAYADAVKTLRVVGDPRSAQALLHYALGLYPDDATLRDMAG